MRPPPLCRIAAPDIKMETTPSGSSGLSHLSAPQSHGKSPGIPFKLLRIVHLTPTKPTSLSTCLPVPHQSRQAPLLPPLAVPIKTLVQDHLSFSNQQKRKLQIEPNAGKTGEIRHTEEAWACRMTLERNISMSQNHELSLTFNPTYSKKITQKDKAKLGNTYISELPRVTFFQMEVTLKSSNGQVNYKLYNPHSWDTVTHLQITITNSTKIYGKQYTVKSRAECYPWSKLQKDKQTSICYIISIGGLLEGQLRRIYQIYVDIPLTANPLPGIHPTGIYTPRTNFHQQENYKTSHYRTAGFRRRELQSITTFWSINLNGILHSHKEHIFMWDLAKKIKLYLN